MKTAAIIDKIETHLRLIKEARKKGTQEDFDIWYWYEIEKLAKLQVKKLRELRGY